MIPIFSPMNQTGLNFKVLMIRNILINMKQTLIDCEQDCKFETITYFEMYFGYTDIYICKNLTSCTREICTFAKYKLHLNKK